VRSKLSGRARRFKFAQTALALSWLLPGWIAQLVTLTHIPGAAEAAGSDERLIIGMRRTHEHFDNRTSARLRNGRQAVVAEVRGEFAFPPSIALMFACTKRSQRLMPNLPSCG